MGLFGLGGDVLNHFRLAGKIFRQSEEGLVFVFDQFICGLVCAVVADVFIALLGDLRAQNIVEEGIRGLFVGGAFDGMNCAMMPKPTPSDGYTTFSSGFAMHAMVTWLDVHNRSGYLAGNKVILHVVVFDEADVGRQLQQLFARLLNDGNVLGVIAFRPAPSGPCR